MGGVGFDRLDQIGNEIAAPLELDVDAAEALAHEVAPADQAVEHDNRVKANQGQDADHNPFGFHHALAGASSVRTGAISSRP